MGHKSCWGRGGVQPGLPGLAAVEPGSATDQQGVQIVYVLCALFPYLEMGVPVATQHEDRCITWADACPARTCCLEHEESVFLWL